MRLIRVYTPQPLQPGATVALTDSAAAHLGRVLRLRSGDAVTVFNGDGNDYSGSIVALRGARVEVALSACVAARPESPLTVTLVQGIARGERMDFVVQKATELGIARLVPVQAERSVVRLEAGRSQRRQAHWHGVAIAACEQYGHARLPVVDEPQPLPAWLGQPSTGALRLQLDPGAEQSLASTVRGAAAVELLVGPEGGLSPAEQAAAAAAGYRPCSLGPRVLRSETAAIAALVVLQATSGDLR
jgi:16S rRNA (uracil1498-N3)-methyltransferase